MRRSLVALSLLVSLATLAGGQAANQPAVQPGADPWQALWMALPETTNACPEAFDYFPEGGMRIFYCHVASRTSVAALREAAGMEIFLSGPHKRGALDLGSRSFGHYNPDFVRWLGDHLVPGGTDLVFRARSQGVYDQYVASLARVYQVTWEKLTNPANAACTDKELVGYRRFVESGQGAEYGEYYERWFFYMNPAFCKRNDVPLQSDWFYDNGFDGGVSGNVTKTAVGFWLRRKMDGTDDLFADNLRRLLVSYDEDWLRGRTR